MNYELDPELASVASQLPKREKDALADVPRMREVARQFAAYAPSYEAEHSLNVFDANISGVEGGPSTDIRVYVPVDPQGLLPGLLFIHAGGYVMGDLEFGDASARFLADQAGTVVVSVDYRLAPENPYPAALEDCYATMRWMAGEGGQQYGIDVGRLGVLGESAGGGLAAALALLLKDRGENILKAQFLDAPTIDDSMQTYSMRNLPVTPMWNATDSAYIWRYYLAEIGDPGGSEIPIYAAPARARVDDLAGLPPTVVFTYQVDPTRDEGITYAHSLIKAGVSTELHHYSNAFHVAHSVPGTAVGHRIAIERVEAVRRLLRVAR